MMLPVAIGHSWPGWLRRTAVLTFAVLACGCDALVTKPVLYGTVQVESKRRNGDVIPGTSLILYTGQRPMGYGTTGLSGTHTFTSVPEGYYGVRALPPSGYVRLEDIVASPPTDVVDGLHVVSGSSLSAPFTFLKDGLGNIKADIIDQDGAPISGMIMGLYSPAGVLRSVVTNAAGTFSFENLSLGNYGVFAIRPQAYLDSAEHPIVQNDGILVEDGSREITAFRFLLCRGSIVVNVRDDSGRVVPGTQLYLYDAQRVIEEGPPGPTGSRTYANLGCAVHGVRVRPPFGWTAPEARGSSYVDGLFVHRGRQLTATLTLTSVTCRGTLRVAVNDDVGAPVAGARIVVYTSEFLYRDVTTLPDGTVTIPQIPCVTEFGVRVVPPDGYTVTEGKGLSFYDGITFTPGLLVERSFQLKRR